MTLVPPLGSERRTPRAYQFRRCARRPTQNAIGPDLFLWSQAPSSSHRLRPETRVTLHRGGASPKIGGQVDVMHSSSWCLPYLPFYGQLHVPYWTRRPKRGCRPRGRRDPVLQIRGAPAAQATATGPGNCDSAPTGLRPTGSLGLDVCLVAQPGWIPVVHDGGPSRLSPEPQAAKGGHPLEINVRAGALDAVALRIPAGRSRSGHQPPAVASR